MMYGLGSDVKHITPAYYNKGSIALETKIHGNLGEEGDIAAIWDIFRKICWEVWDLG